MRMGRTARAAGIHSLGGVGGIFPLARRSALRACSHRVKRYPMRMISSQIALAREARMRMGMLHQWSPRLAAETVVLMLSALAPR